jgi:hypothetical protein
MKDDTNLSKHVFTRQKLTVNIFIKAFKFSAENPHEEIDFPPYKIFVLEQIRQIRENQAVYEEDSKQWERYINLSFKQFKKFQKDCGSLCIFTAVEHVYEMYFDIQEQLKK